MKKRAIKIMLLLVVLMTVMLYVVEWASQPRQPVASPAAKPLAVQPTNAFLLSTNSLSYEVREHLSISLDHVRSEINHTTNWADIEALRLVEGTLTNALAHP